VSQSNKFSYFPFFLQTDEKGGAGGKNLKSGSYFRHSGGSRNPELYFNLLTLQQKTLDPGLRRGDGSVGYSLLRGIDPFFISLPKGEAKPDLLRFVPSFLNCDTVSFAGMTLKDFCKRLRIQNTTRSYPDLAMQQLIPLGSFASRWEITYFPYGLLFIRVNPCVLTKDRTRTGHSQKIVPGLEAFNHVGNVKPEPERSEGPTSDIGRKC
jgi:hypothetical protein